MSWIIGALTVFSLSAEANTVVVADTKIITFLGDSLTDGYGLTKAQAFPALIEKRLKEKGHSVRVKNAGVSGATSSDAIGHLGFALKEKPNILVIAIGANDGLRGLDTRQLQMNLRQMVQAATDKGIKVALLGMKMPSNYGKKYTKDFETVYQLVAQQFKLPIYKFMLDGVAGEKSFNLDDGIHPNAKGHEVLAEKLLPFVENLL